MPDSWFSPSLLHGLRAILASVLIHGLCAFFRPLLTPVSTAPSLPASQFTVCTSRHTRPRILFWNYRCILNCYPISSKTILWGDFKNYPAENEFR